MNGLVAIVRMAGYSVNPTESVERAALSAPYCAEVQTGAWVHSLTGNNCNRKRCKYALENGSVENTV